MSCLFVCASCEFATTSPMAFDQHMRAFDNHWWVGLALGHGFTDALAAHGSAVLQQLRKPHMVGTR